MKILITGAAGFIGMHVSKALLDRGDEVIGIDNLNDYYEVQLKLDRLKQIERYDKFTFIKMHIAVCEATEALFQEHRIEVPVMAWRDRLWLRLSAQVYNEMADFERLSTVISA